MTEGILKKKSGNKYAVREISRPTETHKRGRKN